MLTTENRMRAKKKVESLLKDVFYYIISFFLPPFYTVFVLICNKRYPFGTNYVSQPAFRPDYAETDDTPLHLKHSILNLKRSAPTLNVFEKDRYRPPAKFGTLNTISLSLIGLHKE